MSELSRKLTAATVDYGNAVESAESEVAVKRLEVHEARNSTERTKLELEEMRLKSNRTVPRLLPQSSAPHPPELPIQAEQTAGVLKQLIFARLLARPAIWEVLGGPLPGNQVLAPKTEVLTALDSKLRQVFVDYPEFTFPRGTPVQIGDRWRKKIQNMWICWRQADAIAADPRNDGLPDRDVRVMVESVCHYYYIVEETWSKEVDNTHEPLSQLIWLVGEAVRDVMSVDISHLNGTGENVKGEPSTERAHSVGPVQNRIENDLAEEFDTRQSGTKENTTKKAENVQFRTYRIQERQSQERQNWSSLSESGWAQSRRTSNERSSDTWRSAEVDKIASSPEPAGNFSADDKSECYLGQTAPTDLSVCDMKSVEPMEEIESWAISSITSELTLKRRRLELEEERRVIDHMKQDLQKNHVESPIRTILRETEALGLKTTTVNQEGDQGG
ncbi:hypothetical protein BG000_003879 [Podila horticola]|nr:hypothetical protein BG000_003879 [Podila horticola]